MEQELKIQERVVNVHEQPVTSTEVLPVTEEGLNRELKLTESDIDKQNDVVTNTKGEVERLRKLFNLSGEENNIPSLNANKKNIENLNRKKDVLEQRLSEIVHESNVSHKYSEDLISVAEEKINWINSDEFTKRLKLTGISDEKIDETKEMLLENINSGQPIVLPKKEFEELKDIIFELTGSDIGIANGFHIDKAGTSGIPAYLDRSIVLEEKTKSPPPPIPGVKASGPINYVENTNMSHEMGHLVQDGLLKEEHYRNLNLQTKEGSPDPEYVGNILETDTRIRSMFRELGNVFDPQKEPFTQEHLDLLRSRGVKSKDTKDLFDHYDDKDIIKLANELPAI